MGVTIRGARPIVMQRSNSFSGVSKEPVVLACSGFDRHDSGDEIDTSDDDPEIQRISCMMNAEKYEPAMNSGSYSDDSYEDDVHCNDKEEYVSDTCSHTISQRTSIISQHIQDHLMTSIMTNMVTAKDLRRRSMDVRRLSMIPNATKDIGGANAEARRQSIFDQINQNQNASTGQGSRRQSVGTRISIARPVAIRPKKSDSHTETNDGVVESMCSIATPKAQQRKESIASMKASVQALQKFDLEVYNYEKLSRVEHKSCGNKQKDALINRVASDPELDCKHMNIILPPISVCDRHVTSTAVDGIGGVALPVFQFKLPASRKNSTESKADQERLSRVCSKTSITSRRSARKSRQSMRGRASKQKIVPVKRHTQSSVRMSIDESSLGSTEVASNVSLDEMSHARNRGVVSVILCCLVISLSNFTAPVRDFNESPESPVFLKLLYNFIWIVASLIVVLFILMNAKTLQQSLEDAFGNLALLKFDPERPFKPRNSNIVIPIEKERRSRHSQGGTGTAFLASDAISTARLSTRKLKRASATSRASMRSVMRDIKR